MNGPGGSGGSHGGVRLLRARVRLHHGRASAPLPGPALPRALQHPQQPPLVQPPHLAAQEQEPLLRRRARGRRCRYSSE